MLRKFVIAGIVIAALSLTFAGLFATGRWGTLPALNSVVPPNTNQQPLDRVRIPNVKYCDLANDPEKYDGKTIRVTATLYFMMHGFKLMDKECLGDEKETAVIFDPDHETRNFAKLAKETGTEEFNPWSFPIIVAVGKFSRVTPSHKSDAVADNLNLIFEVFEIEQAATVANQP